MIWEVKDVIIIADKKTPRGVYRLVLVKDASFFTGFTYFV